VRGAGSVRAVTRLVLIRHGESVASVHRRIGGFRTCEGLTALGRAQAEALRDRLASGGDVSADVLISSNVARARETAEILAPCVGQPIDVDPEVGEHDPGPDCDGMAWDEFAARYGIPDWTADPYLVGYPGGETWAAFHQRVATALHRIAAAHVDRSVVVVCHGGVIDVAMRTFLRAPIAGSFVLDPANTSLTEFRRTEAGLWQLLRYNDAAHLEGFRGNA
jgi:2,3-bisphosphoglycerate-dependent phosphoglycerate mutase